ncbi:MAG: FtsX-like permease family protein [Fibromonadaceae bacterium]|nr:FtsX-like permease family protein [Fibromonadaceae bacterium]
MQNTKQGGTLTLIKIAYRNIWRNFRRTVFCVSAVGLAVFFIVTYQSLIEGMTKSIDEVVQVFETGSVKIVSAQYEEENEYLPVQYPVADGESVENLVEQLKDIDGVQEVFPRILTYATLQENIVKHAMLWGLKIEDEMKANHFNLTDRNNGLVEGRLPKPGSNECIIGLAFAKKAGLKIGDRIPLKTVSAQFSDKIWSPEIVGFFNFDYLKVDERYIIVDFDRLQRLLVLNGGTQQLVIFANNKEQGKVTAKAAAMLGEDNVVRGWRDNYWVAIMKSYEPIYAIIYIIFLVVASFLIINTVVMIIHERIKEIGMMGSLGMTRREIVEVFFFEAFFLSAFGAFIGVALGGLLTGIGQFFPIRWASMAGGFTEFPASSTLFLNFSLLSLFKAWLMGVVIASIFTLIPSLKSAFVEPVEALRR